MIVKFPKIEFPTIQEGDMVFGGGRAFRYVKNSKGKLELKLEKKGKTKFICHDCEIEFKINKL